MYFGVFEYDDVVGIERPGLVTGRPGQWGWGSERHFILLLLLFHLFVCRTDRLSLSLVTVVGFKVRRVFGSYNWCGGFLKVIAEFWPKGRPGGRRKRKLMTPSPSTLVFLSLSWCVLFSISISVRCWMSPWNVELNGCPPWKYYVYCWANWDDEFIFFYSVFLSHLFSPLFLYKIISGNIFLCVFYRSTCFCDIMENGVLYIFLCSTDCFFVPSILKEFLNLPFMLVIGYGRRLSGDNYIKVMLFMPFPEFPRYMCPFVHSSFFFGGWRLLLPYSSSSSSSFLFCPFSSVGLVRSLN